ncbi:MBL fold metallo-hydrolase [Flavobacteriaceae bacterium]|nr:MBL fold metallo-hydrolase [Flavobacteriaceae bacterium]MDB3913688.1 MBL fold metallo-hydrolase [Flavobacteriaceae bacterium]MDB4496818.1 MBL fold metallo-hydrolase [Flavobacteriaceae bacterium]MDB4559753.1 MBL fold metallo-hydrolase [Flavobacteriaceae bacterium]MDC1167993.1 MBL fold metallo-hydrolase [Flavobacteriaceae bacterium]
MRKLYYLAVFIISVIGCTSNDVAINKANQANQYITILGTAQDGGFPHIGCQKKCCDDFYKGISPKQKVVSLGLIDREAQQKFLFEATPDISTQLADLEKNHLKTRTIIDGVFITHAHMGHYAGLLYFGKEALGKKNIPVYAMPKMKNFLINNGPWSQLVTTKNIAFSNLRKDKVVQLNNSLKVTPFLVPHRDEFSETVGYKIEGKNKSALFIPDINKWSLWEKNIVEEVKKVDYAFLDATFFKEGEINRPMSEVPHPFIEETVDLFKNESLTTKNKVIFIHFNHTNPALQPISKERNELTLLGYKFATEGKRFEL